jgi:vitamin B12 transport system substrate-binding protein
VKHGIADAQWLGALAAVAILLLHSSLSLAAPFQADALASADKDRKSARIVALAPHAVELLFALGVGDRIVATTDFADYPEQAKSIPRIGGYNGMNIEAIYALEPDLVIAWEGGNQEQDVQRLESLGLNVMRTQVKDIDHLGAHIRMLGARLGVPERADVLASDFERRLAKLRSENAQKSKVRFFYQLWMQPLRTMTADSWVNALLSTCGGLNIVPNDPVSEYPNVSVEKVLIAQPEAIIVPSHHGDEAETNDLWSSWPEIPAVRDGHIFYLDGNHLHRYSLRMLEGIEAVCAAFDVVRAARTDAQP